ncbi:hypothetical protein QYF61_013028 [Mycteria americana]|uniref:Uncharacterized protein n=1 Tax=Mycteria americana TaxID=33587 RepID=A0AAN7N975_MYCAM|nr:hypothetical protein QYF61_013028 [Mycteria americana]
MMERGLVSSSASSFNTLGWISSGPIDLDTVRYLRVFNKPGKSHNAQLTHWALNISKVGDSTSLVSLLQCLTTLTLLRGSINSPRHSKEQNLPRAQPGAKEDGAGDRTRDEAVTWIQSPPRTRDEAVTALPGDLRSYGCHSPEDTRQPTNNNVPVLSQDQTKDCRYCHILNTAGIRKHPLTFPSGKDSFERKQCECSAYLQRNSASPRVCDSGTAKMSVFRKASRTSLGSGNGAAVESLVGAVSLQHDGIDIQLPYKCISSSPTINPTQPSPPLYHVPKHHIHKSFKYLQGW